MSKKSTLRVIAFSLSASLGDACALEMAADSRCTVIALLVLVGGPEAETDCDFGLSFRYLRGNHLLLLDARSQGRCFGRETVRQRQQQQYPE
jgi:hypothetical protein